MAPSTAHASEGLSNPYDLATIPPFWRRKNGILLYFVLTSSLLATASLGIDGVSRRRPILYKINTANVTSSP